MSSDEWTVPAIGTVTVEPPEAIDDDWDDVTATITLDPPLDARSVAGLDEFSHVEVVFLFDRVDPDAGVRALTAPARQRRVARGRDLRPAGEGPPEPASASARASSSRSTARRSWCAGSTRSTARRCST